MVLFSSHLLIFSRQQLLLAKFRPLLFPHTPHGFLPLLFPRGDNGDFIRCLAVFGTVLEEEQRGWGDDALANMEIGVSPVILRPDHPFNLFRVQRTCSAAIIGSSSCQPVYQGDSPPKYPFAEAVFPRRCDDVEGPTMYG